MTDSGDQTPGVKTEDGDVEFTTVESVAMDTDEEVTMCEVMADTGGPFINIVLANEETSLDRDTATNREVVYGGDQLPVKFSIRKAPCQTAPGLYGSTDANTVHVDVTDTGVLHQNAVVLYKMAGQGSEVGQTDVIVTTTQSNRGVDEKVDVVALETSTGLEGSESVAPPVIVQALPHVSNAEEDGLSYRGQESDAGSIMQIQVLTQNDGAVIPLSCRVQSDPHQPNLLQLINIDPVTHQEEIPVTYSTSGMFVDQTDTGSMVTIATAGDEVVMTTDVVKSYKCDKCGAEFSKAKSLAQHSRHHHQLVTMSAAALNSRVSRPWKLSVLNMEKERPHACEQCQWRFKRRTDLKRHMLTHSDEEFTCSVCSKQFRSSKSYILHMNKHTGPQCNVCHRTFDSNTELVAHLETHPQDRPYGCDECGQRFMRSFHLSEHQQIHEVAPHGGHLRQCLVCGRGFTRQSNLLRHMRAHTGERPHQCPQCTSAFVTTDQLKRHLVSHMNKQESDHAAAVKVKVEQEEMQQDLRDEERQSEEKQKKKKKKSKADSINVTTKQTRSNEVKNVAIKSRKDSHITSCPKCQRLISKRHLSEHLMRHAECFKHFCPVCNRGYLKYHELARHFLTHSGQRPFICKACGRAFRSNSECKRHLQTHAPHGKGRHVCLVCERNFSTRTALSKHSATQHSGARCPLCRLQLKDTKALLTHMEQHSTSADRQFVCKTCGRGFMRSFHLSQHVKIHQATPQLFCKICNRGFSRSSNMHRHMLLHQRRPMVSREQLPLCKPWQPGAGGGDADASSAVLVDGQAVLGRVASEFTSVRSSGDHSDSKLKVVTEMKVERTLAPTALTMGEALTSGGSDQLSAQVDSWVITPDSSISQIGGESSGNVLGAGELGDTILIQCSVCNQLFGSLETLQQHLTDEGCTSQAVPLPFNHISTH